MAPFNAAETVELLHSLAQHLPNEDDDRKKIAEAAFGLARAVQPLYDQVQHLLYSAVVVPVIRAANDLELLRLLTEGPKSTKELVTKTGADEDLLRKALRILRYLAAYHVIEQQDVDGWKASPLTKELAEPDKTLFDWYGDHLENLAFFMGFLPVARSPKARKWIDSDLPDVVASKARGPDDVLFVDIGGNVGNQWFDLQK
ncbi:uncharacterized protein HMPREF1541_02773 [Cyphellophora europaea CBS 101466]|uniref:O-methyltransferase dimerisation domain-containing protein n=1 Tax=Cyphellophora europaea (strain CBS 101466) TaxID=1220924 RepID=W2S6Q0_CYPE1|nr:uncharacterized protein HMPREF1541_02773 [Cyphellophora europaea CBS 101466]ETN43614.1 hypothetical protein HMPREF1541_02773 [Cyphellophora europaea CBS 101466]